MSKIFNALKKAKGEQADMLFRPSNAKENNERAPKQFNIPARNEAAPVEENALKLVNNTNNIVNEPISETTPPSENQAHKTQPLPRLANPTQPLTAPAFINFDDSRRIKITVQKRPHLVAIGDRTLASEQFAGLRAKLMVMRREQNVQSICITSSVMNEGKTFVASNLSLMLASECERGGVLIDCDLRNPSVHRAFGIRDAQGLTAYLQSDRVNVDSIIIDTDHRLSIIPAGRIPKNPLSLLDSDKLKLLIMQLRERYDFVILDAPPTAPLPDSDLIASLADGTLFVIRAAQTPLTIIQRSLKMLGKRTIIGTVLNGTNEMPTYSYYYGYGQTDKYKV